MTMLRTPLFCALALTAMLSGCASKGTDDDGEPKRTWTQSWQKMRAKQDADAADFVQTGIDTRSGPVTNSPN